MAFVGSTGFASSFVARSAVSKRAPVRAAQPVRMTLDVEVTNRVTDLVMTIAAKEGDWGGYTGPTIGLLAIAAIIVILSPPLKD
mmetsp:Transcript_11239/g.34423  ORF Transcript_11239/g.34423 Transcript_11239/m.34423 type:complete len:84 (+) Transcript_11239:151-402(+)